MAEVAWRKWHGGSGMAEAAWRGFSEVGKAIAATPHFRARSAWHMCIDGGNYG
ncbi:MAG: hypothetical protein J1F22_04480 [Lachnospiraceae bacterium]|nr:hypothetical protein [Lachnospiraceae bacterium]